MQPIKIKEYQVIRKSQTVPHYYSLLLDREYKFSFRTNAQNKIVHFSDTSSSEPLKVEEVIANIEGLSLENLQSAIDELAVNDLKKKK